MLSGEGECPHGYVSDGLWAVFEQIFNLAGKYRNHKPMLEKDMSEKVRAESDQIARAIKGLEDEDEVVIAFYMMDAIFLVPEKLRMARHLKESLDMIRERAGGQVDPFDGRQN